jgi:hypothetical protein
MKQPSWKTPLILSATLFGVGTFAYWLQYSHKPKTEKESNQTKKPIALPSDNTQIAMVRIKSTLGLIELKCESLSAKTCTPSSDGKWIISNPIGPNGILYPTDLSIVKEVLGAVNNATAAELVDLSEDSPEKRKSLMNDYGLSDEKRPTIQTQFVEFVTLNPDGKPGKRYTAWFGIEHPLGDKTFVASSVDGVVNEKTVFLISNFTRNTIFQKTADHFRDKTLFKFDRNAVQELTGPGVMAKKDNGLWRVNGLDANQDRVNTLLSAIANAKALAFESESILKGQKPLLKYALKVGSTTHAVELFEIKFKEESRIYARVPGQKEIFQMDAVFKGNLDKKAKDFRNTILLTDAEKVTATKIRASAKTYSSPLEFEYAGGNWKAKDPSKNLDATVASKLLNLLAVTRVQDFVSPVPSGKEVMDLIIGDEKKADKFHYSLFLSKDKLYAKNLNAKSSEALLLEDSFKNALPKAENDWKSSLVKDQPAKAPNHSK